MLKIIPLVLSLTVVSFSPFSTAAKDTQKESSPALELAQKHSGAPTTLQNGTVRTRSHTKGGEENRTHLSEAHRVFISELEEASDDFYKIVNKYEVLKG
jgi:hypothetical protein